MPIQPSGQSMASATGRRKRSTDSILMKLMMMTLTLMVVSLVARGIDCIRGEQSQYLFTVERGRYQCTLALSAKGLLTYLLFSVLLVLHENNSAPILQKRRTHFPYKNVPYTRDPNQIYQSCLMIQKIKPFFETSSNMKKKGCRINISRLCGDSFMSHKFGHRGCLCLIKLLINSHLYHSCRNKTDLSKEFSLIFIPSAKGNGIHHQNRRCKDVHCAGKNYNCSFHYSLHVKH